MREILLGVLLGTAFLAFARRRGPQGEVRVCAAGLLVAALVYAGFAAIVVAGGWLAHVAWDVGLHSGAARSFVPRWYPLLCVGFYVLVAAYLLWRTAVPRRRGAEAA